MKFETAYQIMELAEVESVLVFWFGKTSESYGINNQTKWECAPEDIPYFVNMFDVNTVYVHAQEIGGNIAQLFIFLDSDQTAQHWERIHKLA